MKIMKNVNEKSSYEEIYNTYYSSVLNWISFKIKNKAIAEELANDVFIKAFKHINVEDVNDEFAMKFKDLKKYNPETCAFNTWLTWITGNTITDYYRTTNETIKAKASKENSCIEDQLGYDNSPVMQVIDKNCVRADSLYDTNIIGNNTMKAIEGLSNKQKSIAVEFFINELSHDEIVDKLNLPLGTVKATIFRIREKLQSVLKEEYQLLYS